MANESLDDIMRVGLMDIDRDDDGNIVAHEGTITDITERKRAETRVFEEKERAQITLQSIGDGVVLGQSNELLNVRLDGLCFGLGSSDLSVGDKLARKVLNEGLSVLRLNAEFVFVITVSHKISLERLTRRAELAS